MIGGREQVAGIQVARAIAASAVAISHTTSEFGPLGVAPPFLFIGGAAGVDIFFVISGFVIVLSSSER
jgi:peptidoglycan/LPS O-acetylase OafA/YrhL